MADHATFADDPLEFHGEEGRGDGVICSGARMNSGHWGGTRRPSRVTFRGPSMSSRRQNVMLSSVSVWTPDDLKATLVYTGIRVKNLDESLKFYTEMLGMKETGRNKIEATGGEVASVKSEEGGHEIELNYYPEGSKYATEYVVGEGLDHLAFRVGDLDEALDILAKAGHPTIFEVNTGKSRWAYVQDPNGIYIELFA
jgi:lactoylglutathione lyase